MVTPLDIRKGLRLADRLVAEAHVHLSAVAWWAGTDEDEAYLLVGFTDYHEVGPLEAVRRVMDAESRIEPQDQLSLLQWKVVPDNDPRLHVLRFHPWETGALQSGDLSYRYVSLVSSATGYAQALVYYYRLRDRIIVPIPPASAA
ncbi:MAG TPA: hypothetical protein VHE55_04070 [Fimbriimonadaceae bacterium]|nr:hypothetical protein [Fimbriimonadaceae bacterium]